MSLLFFSSRLSHSFISGMLFYHNHVCLPTWMIYAALLLPECNDSKSVQVTLHRPLEWATGMSPKSHRVMKCFKQFRLLPFAATARHMGSWQSLVWINVATLMGTVLPGTKQIEHRSNAHWNSIWTKTLSHVFKSVFTEDPLGLLYHHRHGGD